MTVRIRRPATLVVISLFLGGFLAEASAGERVIFSPTQPLRGGTLAITYAPRGGPLQSMSPVAAEILFVRESDLPVQKTLLLKGSSERWSGSVQLPDSDVTLLLVQFTAGDRVDDNDGNAWHLLVYGNDKKCVRGAHLALAAVYQRSEYYSYKHVRNAERMKQELTLEQSLYPTNWRASIMAWGLLMSSPGGEEAAQMVRSQLDSVYSREKDHQQVVAELVPWFEQTGQIDRAETIRSAAIAEDPRGPVAKATAKASVSQERDPSARLKKAAEVRDGFAWEDRDYDAFVSVEVNAYTRTGNYDEAARVAEARRIPDGTLYNAIAWPLVEKGERLEDAARWAHKGADILRAQTVAVKPVYLSERAWRSRREMQLGMILDTYALALLKLGRLQEAESAYEEADSLFKGEVAETADRLAETYLKLGKPLEALEITRRMIRTGITSEDTQRLHSEAYLAHTGETEGMDAELEELRAVVEQHLREELLATQLSIPAPGFALQSLDGTIVKLEDLRGKIVIVDFWATWCGPCKMSFPYLQTFYDRHREDEDIVLLAVNTWEREQGEKRQKTVRKFLAENKYTFPVLFDETTVEQYGVEGIPTRFIIDQEGMIRFKSIGFEGGEKMLTQMDLQVGLLLNDKPASSR